MSPPTDMKGQTSIPFYSYYVLIILFLVRVHTQFSRYLLTFLFIVPDSYPMAFQNTIDMSYSQYGLLVGFGFTTSYLLIGVPLTQKKCYNCRNMIFTGLIIWNISNYFLSVSESFIEILLCRMFLGIGEAFAVTASHSLIFGYFPLTKHRYVSLILTFAMFFGIGISSLGVFLTKEIGWQKAYRLIAYTGFMLATLVLLTVRNNQSDASLKGIESRTTNILSTCDSFVSIFGNKLFVIALIASAMIYILSYVSYSFLPIFFSLKFEQNLDLYSFLNIAVVSIGGFISYCIGEYLGDKRQKPEDHKQQINFVIFGSIIRMIFFVLCILSQNFLLSIVALSVEYLIMEYWFCPISFFIRSLLPPNSKKTGMICFAYLTNLVGSVACLLIGQWLENSKKNSHSRLENIKQALIVVVCSSSLFSIFLLFVVNRSIQSNGFKENIPLLQTHRPPNGQTFIIDTRSHKLNMIHEVLEQNTAQP